MKHGNTFAIVAALVMVLLVPSIARADSQAGGVPTLDARISALEAVAASLQAALAVETAARQAADATLQAAINSAQAGSASALNAEIAARTAGDSALQAALNADVTARQSGDATLQAALNAESTARQASDATLQSRINALQASLNAEIAARIAGDDLGYVVVTGTASGPGIDVPCPAGTAIIGGGGQATGQVVIGPIVLHGTPAALESSAPKLVPGAPEGWHVVAVPAGESTNVETVTGWAICANVAQ